MCIELEGGQGRKLKAEATVKFVLTPKQDSVEEDKTVVMKRNRWQRHYRATCAVGHALLSMCLATFLPAGSQAQTNPRTAAPVEVTSMGEPAPTSRLTGIPLPVSGMRLQNKRFVEPMAAKLQLLAQQSKKRSVDPEILFWVGSGFTGDNARNTIAAVAAQLKKAGYAYVEKEIPVQTGVARGVVVQKQGQQVVGFWLSTSTGLFLTWSRMEAPGGASSAYGATQQPSPAEKPASHNKNADRSAETGGAVGEAAALQAINRIYKREAERFHDLAHYDNDAAFAFYDAGYTFTDAHGKVTNLKEQREGTEQLLRKTRRISQEVRVEKGHLERAKLEVTYRATLDADVLAQDGSGTTNHLRDEGLYRDTWKRTGNGWKLLSTLALSNTTGGDNKSGKPTFKQHVTVREANMYKLMSTALSTRGYLANVDGGGALACFNSVGTRLFTLPPRSACSDEMQYYVEKSLTLQIKTQINLETSIGMRGGHRGFSQRLHREAFFEGTNPDDEFNTICFVFSDTRWD